MIVYTHEMMKCPPKISDLEDGRVGILEEEL
jgi:hypothetical protein